MTIEIPELGSVGAALVALSALLFGSGAPQSYLLTNLWRKFAAECDVFLSALTTNRFEWNGLLEGYPWGGNRFRAWSTVSNQSSTGRLGCYLTSVGVAGVEPTGIVSKSSISFLWYAVGTNGSYGDCGRKYTLEVREGSSTGIVVYLQTNFLLRG